MARTCRSEMSATWPLSGLIRTLSRHRPRAEFDPKRSSGAFIGLAYSALVTDRAMEAWYDPFIA
jgi:hypothetical protein